MKGNTVSYFQALILGAIQGLTEFLPVSSSGHLVLGQALFGVTTDAITFDIFVHFGTLMAVLIVFHRQITQLGAGVLRDIRAVSRGSLTPLQTVRQSQESRFAVAVIIGTIPAVLVGFFLKDTIEGLFASVVSVLGALIFTGSLLLATFFVRYNTKSITPHNGLLVGMAQALAIIPGISRSGSTIATGLFAGIDREQAGVFSFLLAIPAIIGATLLEFIDLVTEGGFGHVSWGPVLAGTAVAFISGWWSLIILMRVVRRGRIGWFGFYCLAVAGIGLALHL
ncbi:MAG: hypothetical protein GF344_04435 [Chitinivibrionales bacterium]|nr:hypothetical protein [Chitinivibrionales bacterium]MBD3356291.1 hypothetical protein [Chitinivibrionales bacterium]